MDWSNNQNFEGAPNVCNNSVIPYSSGNKNIESTTRSTPTQQSKVDALQKKLEILKNKQQPGQTQAAIFQKELDEDSFPSSINPNTKSHNVAHMIINKDELCTGYTDIAGQFTFRSRRGNQYVLVGYHYDTNCIIAEPLRNRTTGAITQAWNKLIQVFEQEGIESNTYIMDNETYGEFMRALNDKGATY